MDASLFDAIAYKASVLESAGSPVNAQVEIDSVNYHIEVQYSLDSAVNENQAVTSLASAASVPESQVSATLSAARRLDEKAASLWKIVVGRRLATTVDVRVSTTAQDEVTSITDAVGNTGVVQNAMRAQGVSAGVTVAQSPTHKVSVSTRILSATSAPVSPPDTTSLATQLSYQLGTDVAVTVSSVQQTSSCSRAGASLLLWCVILSAFSMGKHY